MGIPIKVVSSTKPSGTISITENGEYDVARYAMADVNVSGGGDGDSFITTKVTFINNTDNFNTVFLPNIIDIPDNQLIVGIHYAAQGTTEANVPLVGLGANLIFSDISGISITVSGDIEGEDEEYIITGECTITISDS